MKERLEDIEGLKAEIERLKALLEKLQADMASLEAEKAMLAGELEAANREKDNLSSALSNLENEKEPKKEQHHQD